GKLRWQKRFSDKFTASPVAAGGNVYFASEAGTTVVVQAGIGTYRELARNSLGEAVFASPSISQGRFFIRTVKRLYCIGNHPETPAPKP
ncbi:MAG: PQQ-binding-like beta-propeller repeat protein, partial [Planctomycetes bacterium]|nr:PQQ-binding-like beta-propeller repeat protein [Planctomycetota bacterium]